MMSDGVPASAVPETAPIAAVATRSSGADAIPERGTCAQISHVREDVEDSHEPGPEHEGFRDVRFGVAHFLAEERHVVPGVGQEERADGGHGEGPEKGES